MNYNKTIYWDGCDSSFSAAASISDDLKIPLPLMKINDEFENLFKFIDSVKKFESCNIILDSVLTIYKTEANYRQAIAALIESGDDGTFAIISESKDSPQVPLIFRALRALGVEYHPLVKVIENRFFLCFKRGVKYIIEKKWEQDPAPFVKHIPEIEAIDNISKAIINEEPFSLVRVGHCEVRFLAQDIYYGPTDVQKSANIQWGELISENKQKWVQENLKEAVKTADILGFRMRSDFSSKALKILDNSVLSCLSSLSLLRPGQGRTNPNVHFSLGKSDVFLGALTHARKIVLVTPRVELKSVFESIYTKKVPVELISLEGEFKIDGGANIEGRFRRFEEIEEEVRIASGRGTVFLIGAGVAGKQYCAIAKKNGGIGIDMGSMLDAWAGVESRGGGFEENLKTSLIRYKDKFIN